MQTLERQNILVVGASRGLGLGVVQAVVARNANVTVVARDAARLAELKDRLGVFGHCWRCNRFRRWPNPRFGRCSLRCLCSMPVRFLPWLLCTSRLGTLSARNWDTDVKATFHWIQAAPNAPLPRGSRVLISSSGAAIDGSPLSGGYAGAKRMIWMMAGYANAIAKDLDLGIRFQALLVRQIVGSTELGRAAADAYARRKGVTAESFVAGFGKPLDPRDYGEHVVTLLTDPSYVNAQAFAIRGETGIQPLEA